MKRTRGARGPILPVIRTHIEREVDDEIRFHLDSRVEELMRNGMHEDEARRQAQAEYGSVTESRRELSQVDRRRMRRSSFTEFWLACWQDAGYAARWLRRQPALVLVVVITLALGIGGNAIMFGVVDRLLLRAPAHVANAERVVRLYEKTSGADAEPSFGTTFPLVSALESDVSSFAEVAGYFLGTYSMGRGVEAISPGVMLATGNYFSMLGVRPLRGRFFGPADDQDGDPSRVVVLASGFWRRQFAGAEDVIGRSIILDNKPFTVIGVAPEGFNGIDLQKVDLWVPVHSLAADNFGERWRTGSYAYWIKPIARLSPGVSFTQAEQEATLVARRTIRSWRSWQDTLTVIMTGPVTTAGGPGQASIETRVSMALIGVTAVVLLIACANVANLLLARMIQRRRELAMRLALGAARRRLTRQALIETLILCGMGAGAAMIVAWWGGDLVRSVLLPDIAWAGSPVDGRVVGVSLAVALVTTVLAGIVPALQAGRTDPSTLLREDARAGGGRAGMRSMLVVAQASLSVVLLVGAALFLRSLNAVRAVDVGIDTDRTWAVSMDLRRGGFDAAQTKQIHAAALSQVASIPGVERTTLSLCSAPFRCGNAITLRRADQPDAPRIRRGPYVSAIDTGYFAALGTSVLEGRTFTADEVRNGAPVVMVNAALANILWPDGSAVGACALLDAETGCTTVTGVVETMVFWSLLGDPTPLVYLPLNHPRAARLSYDGLFVRVSRESAPSISTVRHDIQSLAANMPFVSIRPFSDVLAPDMRPWTLGASMFTTFGVVALVISVIGLYSVLAYLVAQRRREIGIRMALGARASQVVLMVLGNGLRLVVTGMLIGTVLTLWLGRWAAPLLYGVSPRDPAALALVGVLFVAVGSLACLVPGARATRVDPSLPLRAE